MQLNSQRIYIRKLEREDVKPLLDLRIRNRQFNQPFEPLNPDSNYTLKRYEEILEKIEHDWENGSGYGFGIFINNVDKLIGRVNLSNIVRGAWENCTIGYFLDEHLCGSWG
jgi:[ribosomal protein S5]-alanine N-acetyltransferase